MNRQIDDAPQSSRFLQTGGGKSKSNSIEVPSLSLPKGGGAIRGIDEKFSVNAVNGTASFSIPLPFSTARGASPTLSLSYNSGGGNDIFGLGWNLGLSSIKRKTDKGLPQYTDVKESDIFLFSGAEDLVPEFKKDVNGDFLTLNGEYIFKERDSTDGSFKIRNYRPRIEGLFANIERWTEKSSGLIKWRVITRDNVTTLFGWSAYSVIADPKDITRIFEWLPEFVFDDKGNCASYIYKKEDPSGFDNSLSHNRNRIKNGTLTYTNLYLTDVLYGNKTPYLKFGDLFPAKVDYMFQTIFDYGEYDINAPYENIKDWDFRVDAFSDFKPGFEIRTTRLCKRILFFHHFTEVDEYDGLVKSLNFDYHIATDTSFTFLSSISTVGYIKQDDGSYTSKQFPSTEFEYQQHDWNKDVKVIATEDLVHAPSGPDDQQYQFTDLYNEGLSGILTEQASGWYYKHNLGEGVFARAKAISVKPSFQGIGGQLQLSDLDADGGKQLVRLNSEPKGYFELDDNNEWLPFKSFKDIPNIDFEDASARMLDLNGDGRPEVLITEDNIFTWYESEGRNGFLKAHRNLKPFDEEAGPYVVFSDQKQTIFLADMSGDGLTDIARLRNGEVCYWPNLGYGNFGTKVSMDNAPVFDTPDSFNPAYLKLADIDGSGTPDIIYLGKNKFTCWMNLNGNAFNTTAFEISPFPDIHNHSRVSVTDLLGNGVACIVWSSGLAKDGYSPLRYIDLMNSRKPHIMVSYKNNWGKEVSLEYTPSTKFYIEDKLAGKPWVTKLPFPVHCISKTETRDKISGLRFVSTYKYHHGYYDHPEREFRGFGMVEQTDSEYFEHWVKGNASNIVDEELHQQPVVSKNWFHTGAFLRNEKILGQFAHEYWFEEMGKQGFAVTNHETPLPDARLVPAHGISANLIANLRTEEWCEAFRSCKGMALRSEVFAYDAPQVGATPDEIKRQLTPYSVSAGNCLIELLQPRGKNKHAVFAVKESEGLVYSYERNTDDPRIAHNLNISLDEYGNVLEAVAVAYPRMATDISLPVEAQQAQLNKDIIYTQNIFTNDVIGDDVYRLRLPSEIKTFELKGVPQTGLRYSLTDFTGILNAANEVPYHQLNVLPVTGTPQKRLIEHIRTNYYRNDLTGALPLHQLESLALPFESYQLAYTPVLITDIYGTKVDSAIMTAGNFTNSEGDNNWWVRSGTVQFIQGIDSLADAQSRFYVPVSYTDPYGAKTTVLYYGNYYLFIKETINEMQNRSSVDRFNFRTLSPQRIRDMNNNLSEAISDEMGLVKAIAMMGKGNEADDLSNLTDFTEQAETDLQTTFFTIAGTLGNAVDSIALADKAKLLLQKATARFIYDLDAYKNTGKPAVVTTIVREEHFQTNNNSRVQLSFEYANGLGKVIMKKVQAQPGLAKKVVINADDTYLVTNEDTSALVPQLLRWIGNGRTILNNKGNPVKQYEPYFSVTPGYEDFKELVEAGVSPVIYYDAMGRKVKTNMPDGTLNRITFDSWGQAVYDANDTVAESVWYLKRTDSNRADYINDASEQQAAAKALKHAGTPNRVHFDTLGRPVLSVDNNRDTITGADEFYTTNIILDTEGNLRNVTDARGNVVMHYKYDMLGHMVYQNSMDAGQRWLLANIMGNPLRTWDERNHEFQYFYDPLHRPTHSIIAGGDGDTPLNNIFEKIIYGESVLLPGRANEAVLQAINILGKPIQHFDTGGVLLTPQYDFKDQPVFTTRKLFSSYKSVPNWTDPNLPIDLETDAFTFTTETDALGRITKQTAPDGSIITPSYNEAGLLKSESVSYIGPAATATYIKNIDYNEKGQRNKIIYGNDVATTFYYDKENFRLIQLETKRLNGDQLQDWHYTFDPAGNITQIADKVNPAVFFNNQQVTGIAEYTYDALYRLVKATGRENNAALHFDSNDNWNDTPFRQQLNAGDPLAVRHYSQRYQYDKVGNMMQMQHIAVNNNWTRDFNYENTSNRLINTTVGSFTYSYPHHPQHGFITKMPHLDAMGWNFKEELVKTIRQNVNPGNGTAATTYYQYDGQGQRIRKITENYAQAGANPSKKDERIYVAGYETYRAYQANGVSFERESLSLLDEGHRFVMVETVKQNIDLAPLPSDVVGTRLTRYQLHNHLGAAALELDTTAQVISYEEYHPFGTTAYQANNATIKAAAKRYRYTGMERDEETGLEYHSARYYLPWLGRWCSTDPMGIGDGVNVYAYVGNRPIVTIDQTGQQADNSKVTGNNKKIMPTPGFIDYMDNFNARHTDLKAVWDYTNGHIIEGPIREKQEKSTSTAKNKEDPPSQPKPKNQSFAIYVAFPNAMAAIGSLDNSDIAKFARKWTRMLPDSDRKFRVGHAGVILINGENGKTTFTDFGRFGKTKGYGITRVGHSDFSTMDAEFDQSGNLLNAEEIMRSLSNSKGIKRDPHGNLISYATVNNVDYGAMLNYAQNYGTKKFGFEDQSSYCAKYALELMDVGKANAGKWDINALLIKANALVKSGHFLQAKGLIQDGPTPENIVKSIKNNYKEINTNAQSFSFH